MKNRLDIKLETCDGWIEGFFAAIYDSERTGTCEDRTTGLISKGRGGWFWEVVTT